MVHAEYDHLDLFVLDDFAFYGGEREGKANPFFFVCFWVSFFSLLDLY